MRRVVADTNVFLYAVGGAHELREPCRAIVEAAGDGRLHLTISAEVIQEYAHVRLRRGAPAAQVVEEANYLAELCEVVPLDGALMLEAVGLLNSTDGLHVRDLVMVATAARSDLADVVTADTAFEAVAGLRRLDPRDLAADLS